MPSVTPSGSLSLPLHLLRGLVTGSAAWQAWCGGVTPAASAAFLVAAPSRYTGPHTIIDHDNTLSRTRDGVRIGRFQQNGGLLLYFAAPVVTGADTNDAMTDFLNRVDAVLADIEQAPPQGGAGIVVNGYSLAGGPSRIPQPERDKNGDNVEVMFALDVTVWP